MPQHQNFCNVSLKHYHLNRSDILELIEFLSKQYQVYAPHKKGKKSYAFDEVKNSKLVELNYPRTIQPLKKFFIPPKEVLLKFNTNRNDYKPIEIETDPQLFFAVHSYDLEAIKRLDTSFIQGNAESNYLNRRKNAIFIGINFIPDKTHFSSSVGIPIEQM
ncbi:hypothetical protein KAJ27_19275, partial [bacterium]|nr:hypothetical protein [bacterium]